MSEYRQELKQALSEARGRRQGTIFALATARGIELNGKGTARQCPWCGQKGKLNFYEKDGVGKFRCPVTSCDGNGGGDEIAFIMLMDGLSNRDATRSYLESAGVEHPWDRFQKRREEEKKERPRSPQIEEVKEPEKPQPVTSESPPPQEEIPEFIRIPDIGANPFEEIWKLLTLADKHRKEIQKKRGLDDPWIDAFGFRSSLQSNRQLLAPILDKFPPGELMRLGLAQKKKGTNEILIAHSLCGMGMNKETEKPDFQVEPIIIPYFDREGRLIDLRAHKMNLTNKAHLEEENSGFYDRQQHSLVHPFCEGLIVDRPEEFRKRCVITEGEFKAHALRRCGIPAMAFPGIMSLKNEFFLKEVVQILSRNDIREVAFVFDNQCRDHKPMDQRFEEEVYAQISALILERYQFRGKVAMLPNSWRMPDKTGKADWDGALADLFIKKNRTYAAGIAKASAAFREVIESAKPVSLQSELWKGPKEAAIAFRLKKELHEPDVFVGGKKQLDQAAEITRWCDPAYADILNAAAITKELRATYGGYYLENPLPQKERPRIQKIKTKIMEDLDKIDPDDRDKKRALYAAKMLCDIILYHRPKIISDFTMISRYKLRTIDGREDRLVQFIDNSGIRSKQSYQLTGKRMSTATQFREFALESGGYHWTAGQDAIDSVAKNLDIDNYQKVIHAIDVVGYQKETGIYILGDCGVAPDGQFIFPDRDGIIWWKSSGYRYSDDDMANLIQKPPILFPNAESAKAAYGQMDWDQERKEVKDILEEVMEHYIASYGDHSGWLSLGMTFQYLAQPEIFARFHNKPGLWVQGRKGSGKTETTQLNMRMLAFPSDYGSATVTGTKVGLERGFAQYCGLPVHIDEWRNNEVPPNAVSVVRNAFNEQGQPKGMADGSKRTRVVRPLTMPIVTGEDACTDAATMSRFVKLVMAESRRTGTTKEQAARFVRMVEASEEYHRIGRYLFHKRREFAKLVTDGIARFTTDPVVMQTVPTSRARQVYGTAWASMNAAYILIIATEDSKFKDLETMIPCFAGFAKQAAEDTEREVFVTQFFDDCLSMISRGIPKVERYLRVEYGVFVGNTWRQAGSYEKGAQLYLLVAPKEIYDEYEQDKRRRGSEISLTRQNIQLELRREAYWVEADASLKPKAHRFKLSSDDMRRTWWIMDFEKMPPDIREIFANLIPESEQENLTI